MKIELKVWVYAGISDRWNAETCSYKKETTYHTISCDLTDAGYAMVSRDPFLIQLDIPDNFDVVGAKVDGLKAQIKKEEGESYIRTQQLKQQINDLLMLPSPTVISKPEDDIPF